jgi:DNA-directed RNA polymerase specialized sigma24 family protein
MAFPMTRWTFIRSLRDPLQEVRDLAMANIIGAYWKPLYASLRGDHSKQDSEDLVQGFFTYCLEAEVLEKADATKGKFRSYLLTCLKNFASNAHRHDQAQKRKPPGGLVPIEVLVETDDSSWEPRSGESSEAAFERVWKEDLLRRAMAKYKTRCLEAELGVRYELFRRCVVEPFLTGAARPGYEVLGSEFRLSGDNARKAVLKATSEVRSLVEQEVGDYALSDTEVHEDVDAVLKQIRQV